MVAITSPGLGSGLDINGLVSQLLAAEAQGPTLRLDRREANLQVRLSGYGSIKSAISGFQSSLSVLNNLSTYNSRTVSSSDTDVLTAVSTGEAGETSYDITVSTLADSHKLSTDPTLAAAQFTSASDVLGTGKLTFKFGTTTYTKGTDTYSGFVQNTEKASATVNITDGSLEGIRDAINAADIGVSASIINDGTYYRLAISSDSTGAENSLEITVDDDDLDDANDSGLSLLSFNSSSHNIEQTVAAADATFNVNGIAITSASNTVTDAIENVTLTLKEAGTSTVSVEHDENRIRNGVKGFVSAYNQFLDTVGDLTGYDAETKTAGTLNGDATVRTITSTIQRLIGSPVGNVGDTFTILADIGITTNSSTGKLEIDDTELDDVIANNPSKLTELFAAFGATTDNDISFDSSTADTVEGKYSINITQMATRGVYAGSAAANTTITAGSNDNLTIEIDGTTANITLAPGTYTAATLAAQVQAQVNGTDAFASAGISVQVTEAAGVISITSNRYGSASKVDVTGGNGKTDLLGGSPTATDGLDVAGTIGGLSATGSGQYLTGSSGKVEGLKLLIADGATGSRGTVDFKRGFSDRINSYLEQLLATDGVLNTTTSSLEDNIADIANDRESLALRLESIEKRLRAQFLALDTLVSQLQNTSNFLTQQLSALPTVKASTGQN